ncbi:hypothetical protein [Cronobacter phage vB_Cdu_VP8]|nr:hypothetical protein [Cronobacter phage vB_Cdu_VP8]
MTELNEVMNDDSLVYPVINLKPNLKVPQMWNIKAPGNDTFALRLVSSASEGDAVKNMKQGDKVAIAFVLSVKENGSLVKLQGGFGSDPYGLFATAFETIWETVQAIRLDAVLFRIPIKQVKGQIKGIQRIIERLVMRRSGGQFAMLKELQEHNQKYAFILLYRRSKKIEMIPGLPKLNLDDYFSTKLAGAEVLLDKKTGEEVSKPQAIAKTIAKKMEKISDQVVIAKSKLSRQQLARSQNSFYYDKMTPENMKALDKITSKAPVIVSTDAPVDLLQKAGEEVDHETDFIGTFSVSDARKALTLNGQFGNKIVKDEQLEKFLKRIKKYNKAPLKVKCSMACIKDIVTAGIEEGVFENNDPLSQASREDFISAFLKSYMEAMSSHVQEASDNVSREDTLKGAPASVKSRVSEYTISWYDSVNPALQGYGAIGFQEKHIATMDKAFEYGTKLEEGTTLWRGMQATESVWDSSIESKLFYFANYVSCSLYPIIFGGFGDVSKQLSGMQHRKTADIDAGDAVPNLDAGASKVRVGFAISGADKVKVVVPGPLSEYPEEGEVILPRGTTIAFNKVHHGLAARDAHKKAALVEATVIAPEELTEATEIYDGDALLETGKLVKLSDGVFSKFLQESVKVSDKIVWESLVSAMQPLPPKFEI